MTGASASTSPHRQKLLFSIFAPWGVLTRRCSESWSPVTSTKTLQMRILFYFCTDAPDKLFGFTSDQHKLSDSSSVQLQLFDESPPESKSFSVSAQLDFVLSEFVVVVSFHPQRDSLNGWAVLLSNRCILEKCCKDSVCFSTVNK